MKEFDLSRVAIALSVALSLTLSFVVVDVIAAEGMKAVAALKSSRPVTQPLHAQSHRAAVRNAASARVC
jgi:hypothetical protein